MNLNDLFSLDYFFLIMLNSLTIELIRENSAINLNRAIMKKMDIISLWKWMNKNEDD